MMNYMYISTPGQTITSLLNASHCPANSAPSPSLSLLVQRAIVKNTNLEKLLDSGRFCDWSIGNWRGEPIMVKTYLPNQEKMWFSETEIHQVSGREGWREGGREGRGEGRDRGRDERKSEGKRE